MKLWIILAVVSVVIVLAFWGVFMAKNFVKADTRIAETTLTTGCGCGTDCACGCQGQCSEGSDCGCLSGQGCSAANGAGGVCGCSK